MLVARRLDASRLVAVLLPGALIVQGVRHSFADAAAAPNESADDQADEMAEWFSANELEDD